MHNGWIVLVIGVTPLVVFGVFVALVKPDPDTCVNCGHLPADHGNTCGGDEFDVGELVPNGKSCGCVRYRRRSTTG
ncbi:hypothetical protein [Embleya sp. MST-111070]|uniref:hypothetical protein n=1 Tax=Embleya sp. MST-111070 TaxID=3398231 RepID=UPI003F7336CA